jgi:hypothetical protein
MERSKSDVMAWGKLPYSSGESGENGTNLSVSNAKNVRRRMQSEVVCYGRIDNIIAGVIKNLRTKSNEDAHICSLPMFSCFCAMQMIAKVNRILICCSIIALIPLIASVLCVKS